MTFAPVSSGPLGGISAGSVALGVHGASAWTGPGVDSVARDTSAPAIISTHVSRWKKRFMLIPRALTSLVRVSASPTEQLPRSVGKALMCKAVSEAFEEPLLAAPA